MQPKKPSHPDPFAAAFLERLQDRPEAEQFVLGGGFALKHYLDYRATADVDAWWRGSVDPNALDAARAAFADVAREFGYTVQERQTGTMTSIEAVDGKRKVFSFQVALRTVEIERPVRSPWGRFPIETFDENVAAKMNALVNRGAPRDFRDIREIVAAGLATPERCWELWAAKNPGSNVADARLAVQNGIAGIAARTPLDRMDPADRGRAAELRAWFRDVFAADGREHDDHDERYMQ